MVLRVNTVSVCITAVDHREIFYSWACAYVNGSILDALGVEAQLDDVELAEHIFGQEDQLGVSAIDEVVHAPVQVYVHNRLIVFSHSVLLAIYVQIIEDML
mmetsp:Transcript_342/g.468  ORF Transcript_342/g.468 Transcript_342/m.468 type:complete len:101 (-) Transcript_342:1849-2151(-)